MLETTKATATSVGRILNEKIQVRVQCQGALPEHADDIHKVIRLVCRAQILQKSVHVQNGCPVCEVEGEVHFCVVYRAEESGEVLGLSSHTFTQPFTATYECSALRDFSGEYVLFAAAETTACGCKLLTKKKVDLGATVAVEFGFLASEEFSYLCEPCEGVELLCEPAEHTVLCDSAESRFQFEEEIILPQELPSVMTLLDCQVRLCASQAHCEEDGVDFSVDALLDCTYFSEADEAGEGRLVSFSQPIEIRDAMPCAGAKADRRVLLSATAGDVNVQVLMDSFGARRSFKLRFGYLATAAVLETVSVPMCKDAYSLKGESRAMEDTLHHHRLQTAVRCKEEESVVFECSEPLNCVEGTRVQMLLDSVELCDEGVALDCELVLSALGVRTEDERIVGVSERQKKRFVLPVTVRDTELIPVLSGGVLDAVGAVSEGGIEVKLCLCFEVALWKSETCRYLSDVAVSEEDSERFCGLYFCHPSEDDTPWSLAKRYRVKLASLLSDNNLSSDGPLPELVRIVKV